MFGDIFVLPHIKECMFGYIFLPHIKECMLARSIPKLSY